MLLGRVAYSVPDMSLWDTLNHPPVCPSIHSPPIQSAILLLSGSFLITCSVSSHVLDAGVIERGLSMQRRKQILKRLVTQTGDTTAGDAEMAEPTTTALTVGPRHGVSQWALCCLDHGKRWLVVQFESYGTNHLLERSLLAVSERKNVIHHPCTVRERRPGEEGKQVQEGNDSGGHKKTVRKMLHPGPL